MYLTWSVWLVLELERVSAPPLSLASFSGKHKYTLSFHL